jgi:hypothetical protein
MSNLARRCHRRRRGGGRLRRLVPARADLGAIAREQRQPLAGDELLPEATALTTRAITIAAPSWVGHG